jgi:hypothetical protein
VRFLQNLLQLLAGGLSDTTTVAKAVLFAELLLLMLDHYDLARMCKCWWHQARC